jgi:hypothetical protein
VSSNRAAGQYDLGTADAELPDPEWPELSFREILKMAFQDAMIDSIDHPAIRRLRGKA